MTIEATKTENQASTPTPTAAPAQSGAGAAGGTTTQYQPERFEPGTKVKCKRHGTVRVVGCNSQGWPEGRVVVGKGKQSQNRGRKQLIFTPTVCKLIRTETTTQIAKLLGVNPSTACQYRKLLGLSTKPNQGRPRKAGLQPMTRN